jgi:hypothetical protein
MKKTSTKLDIISEIINENYLAELHDKLIEEGVTDMKITAKETTYKLYKFDKKGDYALFPFFNNKTKDLTKMCDYVLFAERGKHFTILIIELKASNGKQQKQLLAGKQFVLFLLESAKRIEREIKIEQKDIRLIFICEQRKEFPDDGFLMRARKVNVGFCYEDYVYKGDVFKLDEILKYSM